MEHLPASTRALPILNLVCLSGSSSIAVVPEDQYRDKGKGGHTGFKVSEPDGGLSLLTVLMTL